MPPSNPTAERRLLTTDEAAAYLNTSPRHIRKMWNERRIPGVKVGRLIRFDLDDLNTWIAARRVEAKR
jgi:excisionase family DNA binding protein